MAPGDPKRPRVTGSGGALVSQSARGTMIHAANPPPPMYRTLFGRLKIVTVQSDYLECHIYDLAPDGTAVEGANTVYVAKPHPLRGGGGSYSAGDIIVAARNNTGGVGVLTAGGAAIEWEDVVSAGGGGGGGGGVSVADTTSVIVAETATAGVAATAMRSDAILGLKLYATQPGIQFYAASAGLGIIWGVVGYMTNFAGAAASAGTRGEVARIDHDHGLPGTLTDLTLAAGDLSVDWSAIEVDNDTIKYAGGTGIYVSRVLVDGDFSMAGGASLAHVENANEPVYSTGSGLGLALNASGALEKTGSGPAEIGVRVDGTTIGINGSNQLYVI